MSTLPDMKFDTSNYIHLQRFYKTYAEEEKQAFKSHLCAPVDDTVVNLFIKNAHVLQVLRSGVHSETAWITSDPRAPLPEVQNIVSNGVDLSGESDPTIGELHLLQSWGHGPSLYFML
ncbi:hypothetical protein HD554DRAFT_2037139 [Boletus coccyginus]|nr:hypothetical protein HD554DRAFT_2037139 [Boletus coccyginus]